MEPVAAKDFDRAWLVTRLQPREYFARCLQSSLAQRREWYREWVEGNQAKVQEVWQDGDELWYWRYRIDGGISGSDGLALLRADKVVNIWYYATIL
jgi:hypothetical protein